MSGFSTSWIEKGAVLATPPWQEGRNDDDLLHRGGLVRITTGDRGTEIKWSVLAPNFASLFYAAECLRDLKPPFMLRYFLAGWFEEARDTPDGAARRIHEIIARSDIHLVRRTFVREFDPGTKILPPLLQNAWIDGGAESDYAVDCIYEESSGRFRVDWIGPKSTIARLWGLAPVSYPCQPGGSYDKIVSAAYADVLRAGRPRYDHVYAAMLTPDANVVWIPYQRIIVPKRLAGSRRAVSIVTEIAKVDIEIV